MNTLFLFCIDGMPLAKLLPLAEIEKWRQVIAAWFPNSVIEIVEVW